MMRYSHADITHRDVNIFRSLAPGPKTMMQLRDAVATLEESRKDTTPLNHDLKMATLKTRIHKLCKAGHIKSRRYRSRSGDAFALYALTPASVEVLKTERYPVNHVRVAFPNENTVTHEMLVIKVVERYWCEPRIFEKNGRTLKMRIKFIDENVIKSSSKGGKKGWRYPDLLTTLIFDFEDQMRLERTLAVEIDNNTMPPDRVFAKVKGMFERTNYATAMLCTNVARVNELRRWFKKEIERLSQKVKSYDERKRLADLIKNVAFGIHDDFLCSGFRDTEWKMIDECTATFIPIEFAK